jgi:peptidoglycan/xylan/chitin deacetylase (PgdA/CDA1 family)
MHRYFIKTPGWVKTIFSKYTWAIKSSAQVLYLTFDDGPHPTITPWVLDELKKWNAKATFFCIGKNVALYPDVYRRIVAEGHTVGNHTYNHLNGWKTDLKEYIDDIQKAAGIIRSSLFRPPYGRIKRKQANLLHVAMGRSAEVVMWDVLSGDFDKKITEEQCLKNVINNIQKGSIVVFHDSDKAYKNLQYTLPLVLQQLAERGYTFERLVNNFPQTALNN